MILSFSIIISSFSGTVVVNANGIMSADISSAAIASELSQQSYDNKTNDVFKDMDIIEKDELPAAVSFENALQYGHKERLRLVEDNEYTLVFKNTDDTETKYLFAYPVKYKDENGEWKDISMKLAYDKSSDKYVTKQSNIMSAFSKRSVDGISLRYDIVLT